MPNISLTEFVDFIAKSGTPKLTHVRAIKNRPGYDPATDFWKRLREGIVEFHRSGNVNKNLLSGITAGLTDTKKRDNYPNAITAYKTFLGKKNIDWFNPQSQKWTHANLDIRVNPELGLVINGKRHHLKLYLKKSPLKKDKADMILLLLQQGLTNAQVGDTFAILDVQNNKLFADKAPNPTLLPLLQGEATSFSTMWNALP